MVHNPRNLTTRHRNRFRIPCREVYTTQWLRHWKTPQSGPGTGVSTASKTRKKRLLCQWVAIQCQGRQESAVGEPWKGKQMAHDNLNEDCEKSMYEDAPCSCEFRTREYDSASVRGEGPSSYDGRMAGPSLDW